MNRVVAFALRQRILVVVLLGLLMVGGTIAFLKLNIEAYPDPVPPLVDIVTQSSGQSAEEIERYVTIPIEIQMAGIPNVSAIRTVSLFGLSDVKIQFTYDFTYDQAQQWVINRLSQLNALPNGAQPQISPESPIGELYRYKLTGPPGYSVLDLKTLQDWVLERRFKAVPGVIDVSGWGGKTKSFDVTVDLHKLASYGLTLPQVLQVINNSNVNVGGQTLDIGMQSAVVRGVGVIHSMDDIRHTMLSANNGNPVELRDIATVTVGSQPRLGIAGMNDEDDIVQGIVLMRRGEQSMPTIRHIEEEVGKINASGILPPGVRIERIYDRSDLINVTTRTVVHNMIEGILLIFLVQWAFLGNLRSAVIVATTIPFALFFAILIMTLRGESANLLSVGAIDFGLVVDATVIMMENIFRHMSMKRLGAGADPPTAPSFRRGLAHKFAVISEATAQVNRGIFFSAAIIIAGFIPLFTMSGVEGHIFGPMARTYAYAILGGLTATFTVSPALASLLLPNDLAETETIIVRFMHRIYRPVVGFAIANRIITLGGAGIVLIVALVAARGLGSEFLPHLEEGNLWIRASMPPSISLAAGDSAVNRMRRLIKSYPEVQTVISQHGRPDDGTDATGFFNAEFFAPLIPFDQWPAGMDKPKLIAELTRRLQAQFPGVDFNFSQYIEDNVEEAASGVKGENSVKLFGSDLGILQGTANRIEQVMGGVPGVTDLAVLNSLGQPTVRIDVDRDRAARYGLAPGDVNSVVQTAIGGQAAGNLYEDSSDRNFPILVRLAPEYRQNLDAIGRITIGVAGTGGGITQIPLADVATIRLTSGASFIYRENQERYIPIKFSVRGRDLGSAVLDAQNQIRQKIKVPPGYRMEWVGEFGEFQEAIQRLAVIVPLSMLLIGFLLYINFGSVTDMLLAASVIPMALVGGIFALLVTGTAFSVSAAIGFVALFGIAAMDGIIVLSYFNRMAAEGLPKNAALLRTCETQMRPVMMTCVAACVGLLPAAFSTGIGSQVQKPLALVVVGGITLAPVFILLVLPVLIDIFSRRIRRRSVRWRPQTISLLVDGAFPACFWFFAIAGCTVGPDFKTPPAPATGGYTAQPLPQAGAAVETGGGAQHFKIGGDIPAAWWSLFHSPALDGLIQQALKANPDLQSAQAALRVAMENVKAQIGAYYPSVTTALDATRNKNAAILSPTLSAPILLYNLYQGQAGVNWTLDLWGANRRQVEALTAQAEAQRYQLSSVYVTLTSNIIAAAVQEASLRAQIDSLNAAVADEREILTLESRQQALGDLAGGDVAAQEVVLAQTEQTLPGLRKQLAQQRDLLTALAGRLPADEIEQTFSLAALSLPPDLPVSLPSKLVEQRPDVRIAAENLHAASAQIGVSIANMLPNITLSATDGTVATALGQLLSPGSGFWSIGVGVTQPIFDGGILLHRSRAARAAYDQAAAQYRSVVIGAFQNVADALHAVQVDSESLAVTERAERASAHNYEIVRKQLALGQINRLVLLNAEQSYHQTEQALVQAQASRFADTAALFQALGGGWWNSGDPASDGKSPASN